MVDMGDDSDITDFNAHGDSQIGKNGRTL